MTATFRFLCMAGSVTLLSACGGQKSADNLAELDAKLTNGVDAAAAANEAVANAIAGGPIEKAPKAVVVPGAAAGERTLGDLARMQAGGKTGADASDCARSVEMGPEWADRLPEPFRLYPGARLQEAAGLNKPKCRIIIASFATKDGIDPVLDFYYTAARRAGFDGEHLLSGAEHQLGGTRAQDDAAYVVFARKSANGETEVDLVANVP